MSFEYAQFPNTPQEGAPGQVPTPQDGAPPGQQVDPGQQAMQFSPSDGNSAPQAGPGGEQKTTLW